MENLPSEILCIIFSYLDIKSRKSATSSCKRWLDVIRNDSNFSNHICYKRTFEELQRRIKNLEWDWTRWPALKTLELQKRSSFNRGLLNDFSIDFKKCPTLEIVISNVYIDFVDLFPTIRLMDGVAKIDKLAFNPQLDVKQFGVEHIWSLQIWQQNDEINKLINENLKGVKELTVRQVSFLEDLVGMDGLLELHIKSHLLSALKNDCLKKLEKLKVLTVPTLAQLKHLVGMDALLELRVTSVKEHDLKGYDLSNIAKRFKNLQKCDIDVDFVDDDLIQPEAYAEIVGSIFQNSATRIKIVFNKISSYDNPIKQYITYLTKEPFQRCALKKRK